MPGLRDQLRTLLAAAVALYEQSFEWAGDDYPCVRRDTPTMDELQEMGGSILAGTTWLVVAKASLPQSGPWPQIGDLVDGATREIRAVNGHRDDPAAQIVLRTESVDG